jgi:hypothetical protein
MGVTAELTLLAVVTGLASAAVAIASARSAATSTGSVLLRTALAGAVLSVLSLVIALATIPVDIFAIAHLLYLIGVVALPLAGLGLLVAAGTRERGRRVLGAVAVVVLLAAPVGFWSTHVAPYRVREDRATVVLRPGRSLERPLRIGVLSDLQNTGVTSYERGVIDRLMAQEPDVILIAGDLFQGNEAQLTATLADYRRVLGRLEAPGGVFVVRGDVDTLGFDPLVEGTGITVLDDEVTTTEVDGQRLVIGGVRLRYASAGAQPVYDQLEATRGDDPVLLLAHRPDAVSELAPRSRVDLTVAGHTHGGQIALPFVGPLVTMSDLPRDVAAGGLHDVGGNALYVSTGVGMERQQAPQVRFLTQPSYGIVTLVPPGS